MRTAISASTRDGCDGLTWALPGDIREVTPIDVRWRAGRQDLGRAALAIRRALSSRRANPFPLGGDGLLELRIRDVEAVLCRQLDAHSPEPLVSANGEGAPLLGAQLEGGENAFPSVAVVDVDLLTSVREGRGAALADATIVDVPTFDDARRTLGCLGAPAARRSALLCSAGAALDVATPARARGLFDAATPRSSETVPDPCAAPPRSRFWRSRCSAFSPA